VDADGVGEGYFIAFTKLVLDRPAIKLEYYFLGSRIDVADV
jgi:hypothetical protein